ncbi:small ribosomal subunit protein mS38 [Cottoperca gobio]|uniref:Small ribosomal subunit protein mS38 n=1 Tax=Cottoperca gobio TaxID=56716 RepID=A0A6J2Q0J7_COTGO|nr:aurora kinase A-interacting protein [Cottoperca gobio]XP_029292019.1 aurora kinase A-interacting protein [Cottoperca gobio]
MFTSKVIPRLNLLRRGARALQAPGDILNLRIQTILPAYCSSLQHKLRNYSTAAGNASSPRWVQLEPELDEALVPRKMSLSPLESWLSLRYSLPPLLESAQLQEDVGLLEEKVLPPISVPALEDGEGSATPLSCKNDVEVRRRMVNRHKYKKLLKRNKFLRKRVSDGRAKKKQKFFEKDLERIWKRAGLKEPPEGSHVPKIFVKQYGNKRD